MIRNLVISTFVLCASTAPLLAQAGQRSGTPEQQRACRNDVAKLCRGLEQAGDMEMYQCLQTNRQKLSKRCRDALEGGGR